MYKVGFISLGCSKNLVDTEMIIGLMKKSGYVIENNPQKADILVINTCGFINDAKEESINTILEMIQYKENNCKYVIVVGCLAKRYKEELQKLIPEVDVYIGPDEYDNIDKIINGLVENNSINDKLKHIDRVIATPSYMAYIKIAEGCDNRCTYCAIPYIRGKYISRKLEDILEEANKLYSNGVKEIVLVAQDTSKYGIDIYKKEMLPTLLQKISDIGFTWVRFLYTYPENITEELIQVVKENTNICPYFDIPIQHISDTVLKRMGRKSNGKSIINVIENIRQNIPNSIIRTTLIVGFPGEKEEDFNKLYDFVESTKFDKLGCFKYSKEENTPAEKLDGHIHHMTKLSRYNKIMKLQNEISYNNNKDKIGKEYDMIVEHINGKYVYGRTYMDVYEIDGLVKCSVEDKEMLKKIKIGEFVKIKITNSSDYDLEGIIIK